MESIVPKSLLTIAGMDPCGGAGVLADTKTAVALGVNPLSVVTALTVQNTCGLISYSAVDDEMLHSQLSVTLEDIIPDAIKTGMICSARQTEIISALIKRYADDVPLVVDPLLAPTKGPATSTDTDSLIKGFAENLFPLASVVTPNIPECERFLGEKISDVSDMMKACIDFTHKFNCRSTLLKGGHLRQPDGFIDIFYDPQSKDLIEIHNPVITTSNLHGTGCVLSAAIVSMLALGLTPVQAAVQSVKFLHERLSESADLKLGKGNGPSMIIKSK